MNPGISAEADASTTLRARFVITLLKTPAYRGILKGTRGFVIEQVIEARMPKTAIIGKMVRPRISDPWPTEPVLRRSPARIWRHDPNMARLRSSESSTIDR